MEKIEEILEFEGSSLRFFRRDDLADRGVLRQVFRGLQYDLPKRHRIAVADFFHRLTQKNRKALIIDAGANIGASSVFFSIRYPGSVILAVEPDEGNFDLLCTNSENVGVVPLRAALASHGRGLRLVDPGRGPWGYMTREPGLDESGDLVPSLTVDDLLDRGKAVGEEVVPFMLKIDIEGGEIDVFSGETTWFREFPVICLEIHDWMLPGSASCQGFLSAHNKTQRDLLIVGENLFSIDWRAITNR